MRGSPAAFVRRSLRKMRGSIVGESRLKRRRFLRESHITPFILSFNWIHSLIPWLLYSIYTVYHMYKRIYRNMSIGQQQQQGPMWPGQKERGKASWGQVFRQFSTVINEHGQPKSESALTSMRRRYI